MGRWRVEHVGTDSSGVVRGRRPAPTHTSLRTAPFAKEGATAGVTTYNNDSKVVHGTDDQSSSSTATLEYFEYGGFESLNKIPVARLSDGVLLNLQLLFTFEWQFTIEKRLVPMYFQLWTAFQLWTKCSNKEKRLDTLLLRALGIRNRGNSKS